MSANDLQIIGARGLFHYLGQLPYLDLGGVQQSRHLSSAWNAATE